ncbi:hypothetical protein ACWGLF_10310 [Streptomyces puniciscabiei]
MPASVADGVDDPAPPHVLHRPGASVYVAEVAATAPARTAARPVPGRTLTGDEEGGA